jgi:hypothetical protein
VASEEEPYREALDRVVELGEEAVPALLEHLGESELIALALGRIGRDTALEALGKELCAEDWRRVEAAATGLGSSRNPKAIPILEAARGSRYDTQIAEVHYALNRALTQLEKLRAGGKWSEVDRQRPWQQISMVQQQLPELLRDETRRQQAIDWWREFTTAMPDMTVVVPGYDYSPEDAKSRAWSGLAVIIYYLLNPGKGVISSRCPEARYCWEQALKLMPGDAFFLDCLRMVS